MRALHVVPSLAARTGGPAANVVGAALALREIGVESTIFATDMAEAVSARRRRRVMPADLPPGYESLDIRLFPAREPYRVAFAPSMLRALDGEMPRVDVAHIHMLFMFPQLSAWRSARRHSVPYVVAPCGALDPHLRGRSRIAKRIIDAAWQRRMLDGAAALQFKTDEEARLVQDLGLRAPAFVVPNGIAWDAFQRLPAREEFRQSYLRGFDGPLVVSVGRISHKKGLDILVRALRRVRAAVPDARLAIVGPDDEGLTPRLRAIAREEGVAPFVTFAGMLHGREKLAALSAADAWALPSHSENFGLAAVEAMAAGLPVVLAPGVNIAVAAAADGACAIAGAEPDAFAAAIVELLSDREKAAAMGERARMHARRYDWPNVAPQLAAMYERVSRGATTREAPRAA